MTKRPTKMYKFLRKEFVSSFLELGRLKIGTAAEFRIPDGKDGGRSDTGELATTWSPGSTTVAIDKNHPFAKAMDLPLPGGKIVNLKFEEGSKFIIQANAYMFCGSSEITDNLKKRMVRDFGADACVRIRDAAQFAALLSQHAPLRGLQCVLAPVMLQESNTVPDFEGHHFFRKLFKFGWQKELRIVWVGDNIPDQGVMMDVPEAAPLLQRIF